MKAFRLIAVAATATAMLSTAAPASAAGCTVNHYRVKLDTVYLYDDPGANYIKAKHYNDVVTGPNSNVMPNYYNGWRAVYYTPEGSHWDGLGWMWADFLDYSRCT